MKRCMYFAKKLSINKITIIIEPGFWLVISLALMCLPISWLVAWIIAAFLHELFHLLALKMCNIEIKKICIGPFGAIIEADIEPGFLMSVCALAGPFSGLAALPLVHCCPRIVLCSLLQSISNLLPITPLDGSKVIMGVVYALFGRKTAHLICQFLDRFTFVSVVLYLCYITYCFRFGILPILVLILLLVKKKFLANHSLWRYNMVKRK